MTRRELLHTIVRAGMIQFGYFTPAYGKPAAPIRFQLTLLPSFPHLMQQVATHFQEILGDIAPNTRLLSTQATIGVASLLATQTSIPLLYPLQQDAALRIEGTADVSNPIVLITDILRGDEVDQLLWREAARIGLPIGRSISLLDFMPINTHVDFARAALYSFDELLAWLADDGSITPALRDAILHWHSQLG